MKIFTLVFLFGASLFASAQSGITWNMEMNISTNAYENLHPRIVVNAGGNPIVIWGLLSNQLKKEFKFLFQFKQGLSIQLSI